MKVLFHKAAWQLLKEWFVEERLPIIVSGSIISFAAYVCVGAVFFPVMLWVFAIIPAALVVLLALGIFDSIRETFRKVQARANQIAVKEKENVLEISRPQL